ncbi:MAG: polyketide cyclase [Rubrivivax sp.]|nr:MAG: polyketide cyclase [Rubrivivax sp.]
MLKTFLILAVVGIAALLAVAATRPDTFAVQRSATIQAPPEALYPLINDLRQFNSWSPYAQKDAAMQTTYRGPASGPGATLDFSGNKDVGKGSVAITGGTAPTRVDMTLDMIEPFAGHNEITFTLVPQGTGATEVTWAMRGASPFIGKLMGLVFNMDRMIGTDFEKGLANLKAKAEKL